MTRPVGPRGLTVLVIVGIIGLALAVVGWTQRDTGRPAGGSGLVTVYVIGAGPGR